MDGKLYEDITAKQLDPAVSIITPRDIWDVRRYVWWNKKKNSLGITWSR